ncbi:potassium channel family protein [Yeosuana sp. MJ-SS3]|uniref:Potassium channel family protein n=1 Tax=Gilvirhabdus luticola TaxID=3079858 RepID=A0ABU3U4C6_9FLAO|nr:potassium channel family protein [Yeosuana sp. MJ-SS3]MDU8885258.1 potassium channel family protein [Yeosuana sp. MJ-SS3]
MNKFYAQIRKPLSINKILTTFLFLFVFGFSFSQEEQRYRVIPSLTEWIEEINNWPDSVYSQGNLEIRFKRSDLKYLAINKQEFYKNSDSIQTLTPINKKVVVYGIKFPTLGLSNFVGLKNLEFKETFQIYFLKNDRFGFKNITFQKTFMVRLVESAFNINFLDCNFNGFVNFNNPKENLDFIFKKCTFQKAFNISSATNTPTIKLDSCNLKKVINFDESSKFKSVLISNTKADVIRLDRMIIENSFEITNSNINSLDFDGSNIPISNTYIPYHQINNKLALATFNFYEVEKTSINIYKASTNVELKESEKYNRLISSYTKLQNVYKIRGEMDSYNACYIEMKDLETRRLKLLFKESKTFENFFTLKINQFLKVFSAYGTKPAKAIIFSLYVILLFALIYLFFPNTWDKHGKNRIINRYAFFIKYMNQNAGIHEVYLEGQKEELMAYYEYKQLVESSGKSVPKFFSVTALPLYKWAISGTKLSAALLKSVDIMKGTWLELPQSKRVWKSILLVSAFLIAVIYDIFIKMLNALMLSINTFTTLGFGEIPIKGLPRYLAIVQGFIGWFMLTIFSVSLISQLLN